MVSYEVLDADARRGPDRVGEREPHAVASDVQAYPILRTPATRDETREGGTSGMSFRYTGWVRAQKVIPGRQR